MCPDPGLWMTIYGNSSGCGTLGHMDWRDVSRQQAGAVSRKQLGECGLTEDEIRGLVRRRDLIALLPGVYSARPVPASQLQRSWAGVLWSGGVLSHRSAAAMWNLPVAAPLDVHLSLPHRRHREIPPGVRMHRIVRDVDATTTLDGLQLTDRRTTIVDLLRTERLGSAIALADRALQQGWIVEGDLIVAVIAGRCRPGNAQLRQVIDRLEPGAEAESERILHDLLRRAGLTGWVPQYQVRVPGGIAVVDIAFPAERLAIEVDGRRYHDELSGRFESDRTRQNELQAQGWLVLRFTWRMLMDEPGAVVAKISQVLRRSG